MYRWQRRKRTQCQKVLHKKPVAIKKSTLIVNVQLKLENSDETFKAN